MTLSFSTLPYASITSDNRLNHSDTKRPLQEAAILTPLSPSGSLSWLSITLFLTEKDSQRPLRGFHVSPVIHLKRTGRPEGLMPRPFPSLRPCRFLTSSNGESRWCISRERPMLHLST